MIGILTANIRYRLLGESKSSFGGKWVASGRRRTATLEPREQGDIVNSEEPFMQCDKNYPALLPNMLSLNTLALLTH